MMDLAMLGTLAISIGLVFLLIKWCDSQVNNNE